MRQKCDFVYLSLCIKKKLFKAGQTITKTSDLLHLTVVGALHTAGHLAAHKVSNKSYMMMMMTMMMMLMMF